MVSIAVAPLASRAPTRAVTVSSSPYRCWIAGFVLGAVSKDPLLVKSQRYCTVPLPPRDAAVSFTLAKSPPWHTALTKRACTWSAVGAAVAGTAPTMEPARAAPMSPAYSFFICPPLRSYGTPTGHGAIDRSNESTRASPKGWLSPGYHSFPVRQSRWMAIRLDLPDGRSC